MLMVKLKKRVSEKASFSKLFGDLMDDTENLKVVFHDFHEGAEGFELMARFCYNKGRPEITPTTIVLLKSLDGISFWTWSELLVGLKECQDLLSVSNSSLILDKVLDCVVGRLASLVVASYDIRSNFSRVSWWFDELLFLNIDLIDKVIRTMISRNINHATISKFLLRYRRSRFLSATLAEKCKIMEVIINLLSLLDRSSLPCKLLFYLYRVASGLKVGKHCKSILENLIGSQLDQATIDFLVVPSPHRKGHVYDVNLVLRLVKAFFNNRSCFVSTVRLREVASLIDSYLVEVAADSHLNPSKFAALVTVLPDGAREFHDSLFHAIDIYLEVHGGLCEAKKMRICSALNYAKLSTDALRHLARSSKFPSRIAIQVFINQQSKLETLFERKEHLDTDTCCGTISAEESFAEKASFEQILVYAKQINLPMKVGQIDAQLQEMQCTLTELEKYCGIMHTQIGNIARTRLSSLGNNARFLPKLCS